jgi:hypothetical protein
MSKLLESGLYEATDKLFINVVGTTDPRDLWDGGPNPYGGGRPQEEKMVMQYIEDRGVYEYPTMGLAQQKALDESEPFYCYYIHTKGACTANWFIRNPAYWWGQYLEEYTINRWRTNVEKLDQGHDICGVEWRTVPEPHFSGNFWWAKSEYLKKLPHWQSYWNIWREDRIKAEMYVGQANPLYH